MDSASPPASSASDTEREVNLLAASLPLKKSWAICGGTVKDTILALLSTLLGRILPIFVEDLGVPVRAIFAGPSSSARKGESSIALSCYVRSVAVDLRDFSLLPVDASSRGTVSRSRRDCSDTADSCGLDRA